jgi:D-sedoheptulose 7-phosphate isomerase
VSDTQAGLSQLYPFLYGSRQGRPLLQSGLLESVRRKSQDSIAVKQAFFDAHGEEVVAMAAAIADVYRRDGRMFAMGNGGSACDAAHFAVEFLHPVSAGRPALPATHLADPVMMSAVANDVGFEHVYVRQLIALGRRGDGLIGISTSGNSGNLLAAFNRAKGMGMTTLGLAGHDGGNMARSADIEHCLTVDTDSIHRIQETHVVIYHILWDLVHTLLADERGSLQAAGV